MAAAETITISTVAVSDDWIDIPFVDRAQALLFTWAGTAGSVSLLVGKLGGTGFRAATDESGAAIVVADDETVLVRSGFAYKVDMTDDASACFIEKKDAGPL